MEECIKEEVKRIVESKEEGWRKERKVIFWKKQAYIPDLTTLQEQIIQDHYNHELKGHLGYTKTYKLITRNYWWFYMLSDIKKYVLGCEQYQITKPDQQRR